MIVISEFMYGGNSTGIIIAIIILLVIVGVVIWLFMFGPLKPKQTPSSSNTQGQTTGSGSESENIRNQGGSPPPQPSRTLTSPSGTSLVSCNNIGDTLSNDLKRGQTLYTGCGYAYASENTRDNQCQGHEHSELKWIGDDYDGNCIKRGQPLYIGCGYAYASEYARDNQCKYPAGTIKYVGDNYKN